MPRGICGKQIEGQRSYIWREKPCSMKVEQKIKIKKRLKKIAV